MRAMLAGLVDELRNVGIEVSVGEHADAARALTQIPLKDKETVRAALGCALIKNARQLAAFNLIFDLCTASSAQPGAELAAAKRVRELRLCSSQALSLDPALYAGERDQNRRHLFRSVWLVE